VAVRDVPKIALGQLLRWIDCRRVVLPPAVLQPIDRRRDKLWDGRKLESLENLDDRLGLLRLAGFSECLLGGGYRNLARIGIPEKIKIFICFLILFNLISFEDFSSICIVLPLRRL
jgi:hypothetical protein